MKKFTENYETPLVEVIEVEVEQGFATSNEGTPVEEWNGKI